MRRLHHFNLCPFSRKIRLLLQEKKLEFKLVPETLTKEEGRLDIEPTGQLPTLVDMMPHREGEEAVIIGSQPIAEYLDEVYAETLLLGNTPIERAEVRRLISWMEYKVFIEVTHPFLKEKILKRLRKEGAPDSMALRFAQQRLSHHFNYLAWLLSQRTCLAGEKISAADFTIAAHISVLDYLGAVPWQRYSTLHTWYARMKSRPSFRPLLADHISGIIPPKYYKSLDF